jgi:putative ABC transport system permease protein
VRAGAGPGWRGVGVVLGDLLRGAAPYALHPRDLAVGTLLLVLLGLAGATAAIRRVVRVDPLLALGANR